MARKADDLLADLDQLGIDEPGSTSKAPPTAAAPSSAPAATKKSQPSKPAPDNSKTPAADDDDVLADLQAQLAVRPSTPRVPGGAVRAKSPANVGGAVAGKKQEYTPVSSGPPSGRTSEDRLSAGNTAPAPASATTARVSGEATREYHQGVPAAAAEEVPQAKAQSDAAGGGGGGWWGSMFSAATAAVKQAETLAKEIRGNEEAQRWAEQVRGNIGHLQSIGTDLRSRALPTFTSIVSHIAPPISAHERLQIHTTHDISNYPSLDPLIYSVFSRVMAQVEGGDLLVIQRGSDNRSRSTSEPQGYRGGVLGSSGSGWADGPWWREEHVKRDLGVVTGLREGTRLARVSAEAYSKEFFDARGGVEEVAKKATEALSESNPVRSSDIFLAVQAITYTADKDLFAGDARAEDEKTEKAEGGVVMTEDAPEESVCFAIYLHDPIHSLCFSALSQPIPQRWVSWLDASASPQSADGLPESIVEIIEAGGLDPRAWVSEWMEEVLSLAVGVVAQRYVARRMGVGEAGGLGRGKRRLEEDGVGGEAARAI